MTAQQERVEIFDANKVFNVVAPSAFTFELDTHVQFSMNLMKPEIQKQCETNKTILRIKCT